MNQGSKTSFIQNFQGYVEKARKRPEMFPDTMLTTIFSNIEEIYKFSSQFLQELDKFYQPSAPHLSEIGKCFLVNVSIEENPQG